MRWGNAQKGGGVRGRQEGRIGEEIKGEIEREKGKGEGK